MTAQELTLADAVARIRCDDSIGMGLGPSNPNGLLGELSKRTDWTNLQIGGALMLGLFDLFQHPNVHYRCGFFGPVEKYYRGLGGDVQFVPAGFRQFAPLLRRMSPRVMMAQATPPDYRGFVNLSLHHGATCDELRRAGTDPNRVLMLETCEKLPRTRSLEGYPNEIHVDNIDVLVPSTQSPVELAPDVHTDVDLAIAKFASQFIGDEATLQTGIGAVPSVVAEMLIDRAHGSFGIHSEMFTDGLWRLHEAGKVRNQSKGIYDGVSVTTFALGSRGMYDWLDGNEEVAFGPVHVVNDPTIISENRNFVSINGAMEVDLYGQIVADSINGRQISGVGGHEDFVAGAELGLDSTSLICVPSTVMIDGVLRSRIVGALESGAVVSTPRHHTAVVVTEYGAADLRDRTVTERATALAAIAHPQFRDELLALAPRLGN